MDTDITKQGIVSIFDKCMAGNKLETLSHITWLTWSNECYFKLSVQFGVANVKHNIKYVMNPSNRQVMELTTQH